MKITKRQLRKIIKEERTKLLTEAPTISDIRSDLSRWKDEMAELQRVTESGNTETVDMGGLTIENQEDFSVQLSSVIDSVVELEMLLGDYEETQRDER